MVHEWPGTEMKTCLGIYGNESAEYTYYRKAWRSPLFSKRLVKSGFTYKCSKGSEHPSALSWMIIYDGYSNLH